MDNFTFTKLNIPGVILIETKTFADNRGMFMETFMYNSFIDHLPNVRFVQENQSISKKNVLRGLHYQKTYPQGKLIRVIKGAIYDVGVDLRIGSHTYSKYIGILLTPDSGKQIYFPPGFAHGFLSLEDDTILSYKCTNYYNPEDESGIIWNDPTINIKWEGLTDENKLIMCDRDKNFPRL